MILLIVPFHNYSTTFTLQDYKTFTNRICQTLASRSNWLTQEFAFWETAPPHTSAAPHPIYELRTYHLKPGVLLEWESNWYVLLPILTCFCRAGFLWLTIPYLLLAQSLQAKRPGSQKAICRANCCLFQPDWTTSYCATHLAIR